MKKVLSWTFFVLTVLTFIADICFAVFGGIDVQRELDRLASTPGVSGVDYLGVGIDILILGVIAISAVGLLLAIVSYKLAQHRAIRMTSLVALVLFALAVFPFFFLWVR